MTQIATTAAMATTTALTEIPATAPLDSELEETGLFDPPGTSVEIGVDTIDVVVLLVAPEEDDSSDDTEDVDVTELKPLTCIANTTVGPSELVVDDTTVEVPLPHGPDVVVDS